MGIRLIYSLIHIGLAVLLRLYIIVIIRGVSYTGWQWRHYSVYNSKRRHVGGILYYSSASS